MITSEIKFSQMEDRMDAEYYKPEFLQMEEILSNQSSTFQITNLKKDIIHPKEFKREYSQTGGIPFLRVTDIIRGYIDTSNVEFVYPLANIDYNKVYEGDILISRSGTVGIPAIVTEEFNGASISADFLILRLKTQIQDRIIVPYYIYIFLASKYGIAQTQRNLIGCVQKHINTEGLSAIKIPIPSPSFQSHIESLVKTAREKRKEAQRELQEAEEMLEKALGWKGLELNHERAFETSVSHLERRFDPEYFKPRYERIKKVLLAKNAKPLSEGVKIVTKRTDFRKTPDKIIKYVAIADIDPESSQIISHTEMPAYQAPSRATYEIKEGCILTATSGNSTGTKRHASCFVTEKENDFICTNGLVPLQPKESTEPLYLLFYLKSPFFLEQVRRELTGAAIPAISLEDMKQILIYLPSKEIQKKISKLIEASNQLRTESRDLIEQAKRKVEEMVEKREYGD
jgi:restriction endonuclease S subunit